jgi:hypothetical protein
MWKQEAMKKLILYISCSFVLTAISKSQDTIPITDDHIVQGIIIGSDTVLISRIEPVHIYRRPTFDSRRDWRRYRRLVHNVKKVYPYAKMAGEKYDIVSQHLLTLKTERERKKYIDQVEQEIKDEFEGDLKRLTITQGRILLKLIDREVGETSYVLLKDFKGNFSAFFWQALARIFGHNLKSEFDPEGEDELLNEIVLMIESGQL